MSHNDTRKLSRLEWKSFWQLWATDDRFAIDSHRKPASESYWTTQRELAVVTLGRHSRLLCDVKAAMARIEDGRYGFCENCEEAIAPRRLDAVPWARYCVRCQDSIDRTPDAATQFAARIPIAA
jgi:RNA polymerase-binding transcription factor DksA